MTQAQKKACKCIWCYFASSSFDRYRLCDYSADADQIVDIIYGC